MLHFLSLRIALARTFLKILNTSDLIICHIILKMANLMLKIIHFTSFSSPYKPLLAWHLAPTG